MTKKVAALVLVIALLGYVYQAIQPPPSNICGSTNGPPVTSPRIKLLDGRYMAYKEMGTPKDNAKYKIIVAHGLAASKENSLPISNLELLDSLGIYMLSFDRAGYGESDPNPKRSVKSEAMDVEELADKLNVGAKFYIIGVSMGGYTAWSCLNYIPERLAGAALLAPVVNFWWPSFPANLSAQVYKKMLLQDQISYWIAHHAPSLYYAWMSQKWFPTLAMFEGNSKSNTDQDLQILYKMIAENTKAIKKAQQQGSFESIHRDVLVLCSNWEFDPMNMSNPFLKNEGSVHIWQGSQDKIVPAELQRYISQKLPWVRYHENPHGGHVFIMLDNWIDIFLKALLFGEEPTRI